MPDDRGVKIENENKDNIAENTTSSGSTPSNIQNISVSGSDQVSAKKLGNGGIEIDIKVPTAQKVVQPPVTPSVTPANNSSSSIPTEEAIPSPDTSAPSASENTPATPTLNNRPTSEPTEPTSESEIEPTKNNLDTPPTAPSLAPEDQSAGQPTNAIPSNNEPTTKPPVSPPTSEQQKNPNNPTTPTTPTPEAGTPLTPEKNPPTTPQTPPDPAKIASDMNADKQMKKNSFKDRMAQAGNSLKPSNIAKNTTKALSEAPKKIQDKVASSIKQIGDDMRSTRQRKLRMLKQIDDINDEIRQLQGKISGIMPSWKMALFKMFFPGLYNRIMGVMEMPGEQIQAIKVKTLEAKYAALLGIKSILETSRFAAAVLDSFIDMVEFTIPTFGIIWLLSPIYMLISVPFHYFIAGTISSGVKNITKEIDKIIKSLKERIDQEKKVMNLMNQRRGLRTEIKNMPAREGALRRQQEEQAMMAQEEPQAENDTQSPVETEQPEAAGAPA